MHISISIFDLGHSFYIAKLQGYGETAVSATCTSTSSKRRRNDLLIGKPIGRRWQAALLLRVAPAYKLISAGLFNYRSFCVVAFHCHLTLTSWPVTENATDGYVMKCVPPGILHLLWNDRRMDGQTNRQTLHLVQCMDCPVTPTDRAELVQHNFLTFWYGPTSYDGTMMTTRRV